jgi:hypothetical protein
MPADGPRKIKYADTKLRKPMAEARISQGQSGFRHP